MTKQFNHIRNVDINNDGLLEQIVVVKEWEDGSLSYIDVAKLADIDKGRLKGILQSQHAQHYPVWELLSMTRLSNGINALDFFHTNNLISQQLSEHAKRAKYQGGGLESAKVTTNDLIGGDFTDPASAIPDQKNPGF